MGQPTEVIASEARFKSLMPVLQDVIHRHADLVEPLLQREPADAGQRRVGDDRDAGMEHAVAFRARLR